MADMGSKSLGYSTFIIGTTKQVTECQNIILYNKEDFTSLDRINIYNINTIIQKLQESGNSNVKKISRSGVTSPFKYVINSQGEVSGFNVIIYLHNIDGSGVGYTEFINTQGVDRNINIYLNFQTELEGNLVIDIANSLAYATSITDKIKVQTSTSNDKDSWKYKDLWNYTGPEDIRACKKDRTFSPTLFTTHLSSLGNPKSESNIYLGSMGTLIGKNRILSNFRLAREFAIDPYSIGFSHHQVGYYQGSDISCYSWDGLKYSISSLSETNRFGDPIRHTDQSKGGYVTIQGASSGDTILMFSGRYAVLAENNVLTQAKLYDTVTESFISSDYGAYNFVDETDPHNKIISMPLYPNYENVKNIYPEIADTWYDVKTNHRNEFIYVLAKKEGWYIFVVDRGESVVFSGYHGSVTVHKDEIYDVLIINNVYIGLLSSDKKYLTVYSPGENWVSEKARAARENKGLIYTDRGIWIAGDSQRTQYTIAYEEGRIKVINNDIPINKTWFGNFNRNSHPRNTKFPTISSIVSSVSGVIFYSTDKVLNYL